ncbi:MAG: hypothetical protein MUD10_04960 [Candidatus Pacebacteria bacterium]|nr:hypothetical protein [Candidatus Paceibacterota bacterium]
MRKYYPALLTVLAVLCLLIGNTLAVEVGHHDGVKKTVVISTAGKTARGFTLDEPVGVTARKYSTDNWYFGYPYPWYWEGKKKPSGAYLGYNWLNPGEIYYGWYPTTWYTSYYYAYPYSYPGPRHDGSRPPHKGLGDNYLGYV